MTFSWGIALFLLSPFLGAWIGWYLDKASKPKIEADKKKALREVDQLRFEAEQTLSRKAAEFEQRFW